MPEVFILADDLSGAADCAGGCAAAGLDTVVLLAPDLAARARVIAIDLDTRESWAGEAGLTMARTLERAWDPNIKVIYHKIDSTLRGAWAHELAAARQSLAAMIGSAPLALIAPAFPARGRTTRAGRVLVEASSSKPVAVARDAGVIAAPLRQLGLDVRSLARGEVNATTPALAQRFAALARAKVDAVVCDAETEQDLAAIAAAGLASSLPLLWVGSAGLMRPLAAALADSDTRPVALPAVRGPLLFVVGSAAAAARAQAEVLAAEPDITVIRLRPEDLMQGHAALAAALEAGLDRGRDIALLIDPASPAHGPLDPALVARLADIAGPRLARTGGLVATGGETARRLLERACISSIKLGGEMEVGIPWGIALGAPARQPQLLEAEASNVIGWEPSFPIVTKAGGFGDPGTLVRCRQVLKTKER
ncbi:MAG TPA: four-carbon acid sugar kinase family protein [Hyphomicrobiaceae bacterium]|nr:four-carbon acid sugar kinase family protein [Hyphomicrobiaceae bacterium]